MKVLVLKNGEHKIRDIDLKALLGVDSTPRLFTHFLDVDLDCIFDGDLIRVNSDSFFPKGTIGSVFFNKKQGSWCFAPVEDENGTPDLKPHDEIISVSPVPGKIVKKRQCGRCGFEEISSSEKNICPKCGTPLGTKTLSREGTVLDVKKLSH